MRVPIIAYCFARPPWPALYGCAAFGLAMTVAGMRDAAIPAFCGDGAARLFAAMGPVDAVSLLLRFNPTDRLILGWTAMMLAMMPPLLATPVMHVWRSSMPRRRPRAIVLFVFGYAGMWLAAGIPMLIGALGLRVATGGGALTAALAIALAWSASPWRRSASNRAHRLSAIRPFGVAADRSCLDFGIRHGAWCVASCWAWMMVPLVAGRAHVPVMLLVAAAMLVERLAPPGAPRWRTPAPLWIPGRSVLRLATRHG